MDYLPYKRLKRIGFVSEFLYKESTRFKLFEKFEDPLLKHIDFPNSDEENE